MTVTPLTAPPARRARPPRRSDAAPYSREYFLEQLGPEVMADIEAQVAAAPAPSPQKVEEIRRLFAAIPTAPAPNRG